MHDEARDNRVERRRLLTLIGAMAIGLSVVLGVLYVTVFRSAAADVSRLLPDRTAAWLAAPAPWSRLAQVLKLPRWADADGLAAALEGGTLAEARDDEGVAGIPESLFRELVRAMDSFEVAWLPPPDGESGASVLVFVGIEDAIRRKAFLARLAEHTAVVDRHVGYRIDAISENLWQRWAGITPKPPRVVSMEPWLVFAWGPGRDVEDLLDARVGGRQDAIRRRQGFEAASGGEVRGAFDVGELWRVVSSPGAPSRARPMPAGGILGGLSLVSFRSELNEDGEVLRLGASLEAPELMTAVGDAVAALPHELTALGPADAEVVLSVTASSLAGLVGALLSLGAHLEPEVASGLVAGGPRAAADPVPLVTRAAGAAVVGAAGMMADPLEVALFRLPDDGGRGPSWVALLRSDNPVRLEGGLATAIGEALRDDHALGEIATAAGPMFLATTPNGRPVLAWQSRLGLVEVAPDRETLARMDRMRSAGATFGARHRLAAAQAGLATDRAVTVTVPSSTLRASAVPLLSMLGRQLADDFPVVLVATAARDRVVVESNIGPWTLVGGLLGASGGELDRLFLPGLDPRCRAHHEAMCRVWPRSPSCRPFELGRYRRIRRACETLDLRPGP